MPLEWDHIGKPISTAEMAAAIPSIVQGFMVTEGYKNQLLKGVVVGLLYYNNPIFTDVKLEVWSNKSGLPGRLLHTSSDSFLQAECNTDLMVYRIQGFEFLPFGLKKNTLYHLAIRASGYTGDALNHIAWRQSWPDPQYPNGVTLTLEYGTKFPFSASFITADL
jgi:hypothetical protein